MQSTKAEVGRALASITIRNLDDSTKEGLRIRAARQGRSMEEEARNILRAALAADGAPRNLAEAIRERFEPLGGVELKTHPRGPIREISAVDPGGDETATAASD
jgi:plasmid stability protein